MSKAKQAILNKSRADKFILNINLPPALLQINKKLPSRSSQISLDSLQFAVYGAIVPKISIPDNKLNFGGLGGAVRVTSHYRETYEDLDVNFKVDNNFWNYWVIYSWLNLLNDHETSQFDPDDLVTRTGNKNPHDKKYGKAGSDRRRTSLGILQEYSTNMTMWGLDEYNNKSIQFDYIGAFPTSLDSISYNYQEPEEIDSRVAFSFSRMTAALL